MAEATLVNPDVSQGLMMLDALDAADIKVDAALFMISSDREDWQFVVSSPSLEQVHTLKAYQSFAGALGNRFSVRLPPILILPTRDPFIRELRKLFGKTADVTGMRLGGQKIGNRFVEDAYVFRIH